MVAMLGSMPVPGVEHPLVGRQVLPQRMDVTIGEVREADDGLLIAVRWDSVPVRRGGRLLGMTPVVTTWLRCSEREPELVCQLINQWICGDQGNPRISDVEPPPDVPCGGWLAPDGHLWRCSEITHRIVANRVVEHLSLPVEQGDPQDWLTRHGWLLVYESGMAGPGSSTTQAQRDTLLDLAIRFPTMREGIMLALREER